MEKIDKTTILNAFYTILSYANWCCNSSTDCQMHDDLIHLTSIMTMSLINKLFNTAIASNSFWTLYYHQNYKYQTLVINTSIPCAPGYISHNNIIYGSVQNMLNITHALKTRIIKNCVDYEMKNKGIQMHQKICPLSNIRQVFTTGKYGGEVLITNTYGQDISYWTEDEWHVVWHKTDNNFTNIHKKYKTSNVNESNFKKYEIKSSNDALPSVYYQTYIWYITEAIDEKGIHVFKLYALNTFTEITYLIFEIESLVDSIEIVQMSLGKYGGRAGPQYPLLTTIFGKLID